jgi:type III pantothenate kinase
MDRSRGEEGRSEVTQGTSYEIICMKSSSNVLAIDIGNTRAKFGVFRTTRNKAVEARNIVARVLEETPRLADELLAWWQNQKLPRPERAVIAGSDPETRDQLLATWPFAECRPVVISSFEQIPICVDVDVPSKVGIDRLLNVFAAGQLFASDGSVIVVDSGTATTVDLMTSDRTFRGGSILPGLRLSAHAMHDYTARLPMINVDDEPAEFPEVPGRNTEDAMRAGLFIGQLGAVRELIIRLSNAASDRFGEKKSPDIVVTGGGGRQLVRHISGSEYIDSLALHGLSMLTGTTANQTHC